MTTPPMPLVQVFTPDGHLADIPYDRLHDAVSAGAKPARKIQTPSGDPAYVPADRINDALKAGAKPLPFDLHDADGEKPGFWSNASSAAKNAVSGLLNSGGPTLGAAAAGQGVAQAGQMAADDIARQQEGRSGVYRAAAPIAQTLVPGLNPRAMEQAANQGDTAGVLGQAAVPAALAMAPLAGEAALRGGQNVASAAGSALSPIKPQVQATADFLMHPEQIPGKAVSKLADLIPGKPEYPGASLPSYEDYAANRGAEMNKARAMQDIQMRREATAKATADRAAAKADDAARQPVPLTSSPNYPKWQADQAAAAQAAKDAARADAAARQPVPVSQSPYYAQNQAAQAAEEAARKPVPLNQSPYYTQNQAAAAPAQPLGSVYGPPTPTPEQLAQQGVKLSDLATPQAPPLTSEGRPATWTNDTVRKLAAWGDPDAVDQARARGFGTIQKNYSLADLNPRSVTRFSPEGVPLSDLLNSPGNQTLNPVGAGGARPIVSPANQFESSFGPEHQEVGDLAEWETGNRQGVKVGSDLDQAAKSMFGGKSFDTLTPEQKAHILRIAQTQVAVP